MKLSFALLLPTLILSGCGLVNSGFDIQGMSPDGVNKVVLSELVGKNPVPVDTVDVKTDGSFVIKGVTETPKMVYLYAEGADRPFTQFFLTNEDFKITRENGSSRYTVIGGVENENLDMISERFASESKTFTSDPSTLYNYMDSVINSNPYSYSSAYFLFRNLYHYLSVDDLESLANKFSLDVQQCSYITILNQLIGQTRKTQPGNPYVDFTAKTPKGESLSLSSFVDGKSWILLDFWASWCPYCRKENPELVKIYEKYNDKGLKIISISLDSEYDKWIEAIENDKLTWTHLSNLDRWDCESARIYGVSGIPANILISPNGIIVSRSLPMNELDKLLSTKLSMTNEK